MGELARFVMFLVFLSACKPRVHQSDVKVVNGLELLDFQFPTVGQLLRDATIAVFVGDVQKSVEDVRDDGFCTGTLICDDVVLTAAHCLLDEEPRKIGEMKRGVISSGYHFKTDSMANKVEINWSSEEGRVIHPSYQPKKSDDDSFDIGLVKLTSQVPLFDSINHFPIADSPVGSNDQYSDELAVVGFSRAKGILGGASGPRHVKKVGFLKYKSYIKQKDDGKVLGEKILVTSPGEHMTCYGDSGGPLFLRRNNRYEQVGVVHGMHGLKQNFLERYFDIDMPSKTYRTCEYAKESLFASTSHLRSWVVETAKKMCSDPSQLLLDPKLARVSEKYVKRDRAEQEKHIVLYRNNTKDSVVARCDFQGKSNIISDLYVTIKGATIDIQYSTYDPEAYFYPWATNSQVYQVSKYYNRNDLSWLLAAERPTKKQVVDFMMKNILDDSKNYYKDDNWKIDRCY